MSALLLACFAVCSCGWAGEPTTNGTPTIGEIQRAIEAHRKANPECIVCGSDTSIETGRACDVHHLNAVHVKRHLAADGTNMVTLCRTHHWWVGHRRIWSNDVPDVVETARKLREAWEMAGQTSNIEHRTSNAGTRRP